MEDKTLKGLLLETDLFGIREEPGGKGAIGVLYRPKTGGFQQTEDSRGTND